MAFRFWKYCPVCLKFKILRPEVKTCGDVTCVGVWRRWTAEAKGIALERASSKKEADDEVIRGLGVPGLESGPSNKADEVMLSREQADEIFRQQAIDHTPPSEQPKHHSKTVERDNEFLEKMFGPNAPGTVKDDDEK